MVTPLHVVTRLEQEYLRKYVKGVPGAADETLDAFDKLTVAAG
jgi:hypothetical protein